MGVKQRLFQAQQTCPKTKSIGSRTYTITHGCETELVRDTLFWSSAYLLRFTIASRLSLADTINRYFIVANENVTSRGCEGTDNIGINRRVIFKSNNIIFLIRTMRYSCVVISIMTSFRL